MVCVQCFRQCYWVSTLDKVDFDANMSFRKRLANGSMLFFLLVFGDRNALTSRLDVGSVFFLKDVQFTV